LCSPLNGQRAVRFLFPAPNQAVQQYFSETA
jgi:hypothetical protein